MTYEQEKKQNDDDAENHSVATIDRPDAPDIKDRRRHRRRAAPNAAMTGATPSTAMRLPSRRPKLGVVYFRVGELI